MATAQSLHEDIIASCAKAGGSPRNSEASIVELTGGQLLLAWSDWYGGPSDFDCGRISAMTSGDGGRTWSPLFSLQDNAGAITAHSPSFLRLKSGAILFCYSLQTRSETEPERTSGDVRTYVRTSHDEAQTWSESRCITPEPLRQLLVNDHGIQMSSGRIVLPISWTYRHEDPNHTYRSLAWFSDDDGTTWQRGRGEIGLPKRGAMEPAVVERRDGSLLMVIRTQFGEVYRSESYDGGNSWTPARSSGLVGSESPAHIKRIPSTGDLLLIWNHCYDPTLRHFGRNPITAAISRDDGERWEHLRDLETEAGYIYSYPSILFRGDEALVTYHQRIAQSKGNLELKVKILPIRWFYE